MNHTNTTQAILITTSCFSCLQQLNKAKALLRCSGVKGQVCSFCAAANLHLWCLVRLVLVSTIRYTVFYKPINKEAL